MTLKLVSVEGETIPDATLADELAEFNEAYERGDHGEVNGIVSALLLADGSIKICWFGEDYTPYELMGVFEAAKFRVLADDALPDE